MMTLVVRFDHVVVHVDVVAAAGILAPMKESAIANPRVDLVKWHAGRAAIVTLDRPFLCTFSHLVAFCSSMLVFPSFYGTNHSQRTRTMILGRRLLLLFRWG